MKKTNRLLAALCAVDAAPLVCLCLAANIERNAPPPQTLFRILPLNLEPLGETVWPPEKEPFPNNSLLIPLPRVFCCNRIRTHSLRRPAACEGRRRP